MGRVTLATDDGSAGFAGRVSDALAAFLAEQSEEALSNMVFYNRTCADDPRERSGATPICALRPNLQQRLPHQMWCRICGACASPDGRRICVDGPFINTQLNVKD